MTSEHFKQIQASYGYTNSKMAEILGCSTSLVEQCRSGKMDISKTISNFMRLLKFCDFFDTNKLEKTILPEKAQN